MWAVVNSNAAKLTGNFSSLSFQMSISEKIANKTSTFTIRSCSTDADNVINVQATKFPTFQKPFSLSPFVSIYSKSQAEMNEMKCILPDGVVMLLYFSIWCLLSERMNGHSEMKWFWADRLTVGAGVYLNPSWFTYVQFRAGAGFVGRVDLINIDYRTAYQSSCSTSSCGTFPFGLSGSWIVDSADNTWNKSESICLNAFKIPISLTLKAPSEASEWSTHNRSSSSGKCNSSAPVEFHIQRMRLQLWQCVAK